MRRGCRRPTLTMMTFRRWTSTACRRMQRSPEVLSSCADDAARRGRSANHDTRRADPAWHAVYLSSALYGKDAGEFLTSLHTSRSCGPGWDSRSRTLRVCWRYLWDGLSSRRTTARGRTRGRSCSNQGVGAVTPRGLGSSSGWLVLAGPHVVRYM